MSIIEPGWVNRLRQRRRERRWQADTQATVRWATTALSVPSVAIPAYAPAR
jgi:hypothetical protein